MECELLNKAKCKINEFNRRKKLIRECRWTWPFGHIWNKDPNGKYYRVCVICGCESVDMSRMSSASRCSLIVPYRWKYDITYFPNTIQSCISLLRLKMKLKKIKPYRDITINGIKIQP